MTITLTFTKRTGKSDVLTIVSERIDTRLNCPKQRIIPHDMVHAVVEAIFPQRGFLRLVGDGQPPDTVRTGDGDAWVVESLVETFQAALWSDAGTTAEIIAMFGTTCAARGIPAPPIEPCKVGEARRALDELSRQWRTLPVGDSLTLKLDRARPV